MLRYILMDTMMFSPGDSVEETRKDLMWAMEFLSQRSANYLKQNPKTPLLYKSGVKYMVPAQFDGECAEVQTIRNALSASAVKKSDVAAVLNTMQEVFGGERFRDIGRIIENGGGDCFPMTQKIIVRSKSTGMYELLALGELRHVYPSYEALSYNFAKASYEFRDIIGFVDKGVKKVFRAHLSNGTDLVSTEDHKFWTLDGSGANGRRLATRTMGEYVEAMKMSKNRRTARVRIIQAARIPTLGEVRPSPSTAYLAGIYAAEGNFDGKHTAIAQHKPKVRAKIEMALAETSTGFRYRAGGNNGKAASPGSGAYYALHGGSANPIVAMMREQGLNSFDKSLPNAFLSGDIETLEKMVEGHGDGDAWRPADTSFKRPEIAAIYATSSDRLMEQLRFALLALGRPTYAYQYANHGGEGKRPIWRLHEYEAKDENSNLRKRRELVGRDLPGLTYGIVLSAEAFGEDVVGCIEVDETHNFVLADGTIAKNCDNLATWRVAELRQAGIPARPYMTNRTRPDGGTTYHALVLWPPIPGVPYETSEDPSLLLGMGGPSRKPDRDLEIQKNQERCDILRNKPGSIASLTPPTGDLAAAIDDVLGLRKSPGLGAAAAEIGDLLKRMG